MEALYEPQGYLGADLARTRFSTQGGEATDGNIEGAKRPQISPPKALGNAAHPGVGHENISFRYRFHSPLATEETNPDRAFRIQNPQFSANRFFDHISEET